MFGKIHRNWQFLGNSGRHIFTTTAGTGIASSRFAVVTVCVSQPRCGSFYSRHGFGGLLMNESLKCPLDLDRFSAFSMAGMKRENGVNPLQGRCCNRQGPRISWSHSSFSHCGPFLRERPVGRLFGAAISRKPEDLPAELLFRCFGSKHPAGMFLPRSRGRMSLLVGRSGPSLPGTGRTGHSHDAR